MANTTISPNMNLIVPTVGVDPGPDWATNVNSSLSVIDQHNHSSGSGVQITPSGINISADLPMNSNNLTLIRTTRFNPQSVVLSGAADVGVLYEVGVDLFYNDGSGNQIRITQSGSVTGSTGTITGLPSGTASASFSSGTFTFQSATNTPAAMSFGPISIGTQTASPKVITVQSPNALAENYSLTLPPAVPVSTGLLQMDTSGNVTVDTSFTGSGVVVKQNSPTLTGSTTIATANITTITGTPVFSGLGAGSQVLGIDSVGTLIGFTTTGSGGVVKEVSPTITTPILNSPTVNSPTLTGPVNISYLGSVSWLFVDGSGNLQSFTSQNNKVLTTSATGTISTKPYLGPSGDTIACVNVVRSYSQTGDGSTTVTIGSINTNNYAWIANVQGSGGFAYCDITVPTSTTVSIFTHSTSGATITVVLIGIKYQ